MTCGDLSREEQLIEAIKDELDATQFGDEEWARYELEHDVETWDFLGGRRPLALIDVERLELEP